MVKIDCFPAPAANEIPKNKDLNLDIHASLLRHPFWKAPNTKNNDQDRHQEQRPDLIDQIKKAHAF